MQLKIFDDGLCLYGCEIGFTPYNGRYLNLTSRILIAGPRAAVAGECLLANLAEATELVLKGSSRAFIKLREALDTDMLRLKIEELM